MVKAHRYFLFGLFLALLPLFFSNVTFGAGEVIVEVSVQETAGMTRQDEPITSGLPLPETLNVKSIADLAIQDSSGILIPAQFTVLARWNGTVNDTSKPIKWVLVDFQADVSTNQTARYSLTSGHSPQGKLTVQDQSDKILVSTGKANFQISKSHFNLFDSVWLDTDNDGQIDDAVLSQSDQGGVILTDRNGKQFTSIQEPPEEIVIEEAGSMRAVIKIRGVLKAQDGEYFAPSVHNSAEYPRFNQPYPNSFVYYNIRIHFFSDKDYAKVIFTLENNGANGRSNPEQYFAPIQVVFFDSLDLILKSGFSSLKVTSQDATADLGTIDTFSLYQDWHENLNDAVSDTLEPTFSKGIFYTSNKNNQQLSSGSTNPGWIDLHGNNSGIGLAIRHFWQNFPNKLTVAPAEMKIGLWPEEGYYPYCQQGDFPDAGYPYCDLGGRDAGVYLFDAGTHKTHEMFLRFYAGSQDRNQAESLSKSLEYPLMALASPSWYAESKALGMIAPAGLTSTDPEINEAMQRYDQLQTALVYEEDADNGLTILNLKTMDPTHWEFSRQNRFFGWMNFGDLRWSNDLPASLHYDWTQLMMLNYIRTGKRNFFDAGVEMARHRYDIDQYHGERINTQGDSHKWISYFQFFESSGHADPTQYSNNPSAIVSRTHTWNGGLVLYYLLTGDRKAWEAAEEVGKGVFNMYGKNGVDDASKAACCGDELRMEGWSILNLIHLYRVNGDPLYFDLMKNIAKNRLLYREQQVGSGYWGCDASSGSCQNLLKPFSCVEIGCGACKGTQISGQHKYIIEGLINAHYETQDEELKQLLIRMADFSKDQFLSGGEFNQSGQYRPLQAVSLWSAEDPDGSLRGLKGEIITTTFYADLFAYTYQLTGDPEYLDWARKSFKDTMFYYASSAGYRDPNSRSKIGFIENMYPNSHTKVHGWLGRTNLVYLYTESNAIIRDPDINQDGRIDSLDLQLCINVLMKKEQNPAIITRADINGDGAVNSSDLELILRELL